MAGQRMRDDIKGLAGWLLLTLGAGGIGAIGAMEAFSFYAQLSRPSWAPPGGVFGPVWTALYVLMAVAAWLVWRVRGFDTAPRTLGLYIVQLIANAAWSWLFFAWRTGFGAFIEVIALWMLIAATMTAFWRVRKLAAVLLLPYLAWVSFAAALTYACWQRNPHLL